jgi:nicotinate phosphoribosyltransferase
MHHPYERDVKCNLKGLQSEKLLHKVMEEGKIVNPPDEDLQKISEYREKRLKLLPDEHHRFEKPHIYKVGISEQLNNLRNKLVYQLQNE